MVPAQQACPTDDDIQVEALIAALVPHPVLWHGRYVCHERGQRGLGIGATPAEAHEAYYRDPAVIRRNQKKGQKP